MRSCKTCKAELRNVEITNGTFRTFHVNGKSCGKKVSFIKPSAIKKRQLITALTLSLPKHKEEDKIIIRSFLKEIKDTTGLPGNILFRVKKFL
jgi:hypothetical protein